MSRIAIAQITSSTNKQENLVLANQLITEAKGKSARMIAFPEFLMATWRAGVVRYDVDFNAR